MNEGVSVNEMTGFDLMTVDRFPDGTGFFSLPLCRDRLCDPSSFLPNNYYARVNLSERGTDYSPFKCVSATCKNLWPCTSTPVHKIVHRCVIKHENYMRDLSV